MLLAVGEHVSPGFDRAVLRAANGFRRGMGATGEELCGALAGGVMVIGLLHGRDRPTQNDDVSRDLVQHWRRAFVAHFGTSACRPIYDRMRLPGAPGTCAGIAQESAELLLHVLASAPPSAAACTHRETIALARDARDMNA